MLGICANTVAQEKEGALGAGAFWTPNFLSRRFQLPASLAKSPVNTSEIHLHRDENSLRSRMWGGNVI